MADEAKQTQQGTDQPTAQEMAAYVQQSTGLINELNEKTAALEAELATAKQALAKKTAELEKAASDEKGSEGVTFPEERVAATIGNMVRAGFLKQARQAEVVSAVMSNPETILEYMDKVSEVTMRRTPSLGFASDAPKDATPVDTHRESDEAYAAGMASLRARLGT